MTREEIFIQTKFTHVNGQDHQLPYNVADPIFEQVKQSFSSSLNHLRLTFIDSFILHGPLTTINFCEHDWEAWHAMESIFNEGKIHALGISNVNLKQLKTLYRGALVKPTFVQNRCYASTHWDRDVRLFCKANKISYQGFSLLTGNTKFILAEKVKKIAQRYGRSIPQIVFRMAVDIGIVPITGTTNTQHMALDLKIYDFQLEPAEIILLESLATI